MNIIPNHPTIAMVVGTYGSVPYVHLQLESIKRYNPHVLVLIHDDHSDSQKELKQLCCRYKADFMTTKKTRGAQMGDLSAVATGLRWAKQHKIDILLKVSRRYIIAKPWKNSISELAIGSQDTTYSNACSKWDFGFRSECMGMHVNSWMCNAYHNMLEKIDKNEQFDSIPEAYYHNLSKIVRDLSHDISDSDDLFIKYNKLFNRANNWDGYAPWPLMGLGRNHKMPGIFWHETDSIEDYELLSNNWSLGYLKTDFEKVNN